jgi:hypothetical protein
MPTYEVLPETRLDGVRLERPTSEATDLGGHKELALYLHVEDVTNGGTTLDVTVRHAARNRAADYFDLVEWTDITSATSSWAYVTATSSTGFLRYLSVEAKWRNSMATKSADIEVLAVPKD